MPDLKTKHPDMPEGTKPKGFYIPSLDGIRTIAFMLVFVSHAGLGHLVPGGLGVTIFFFLSGYLITTLLRREYEKNGRVSFKKFYMRRILRIWPPFYCVLLLAMVTTWLVVPESEFTAENFKALLAQTLHVANYYVIGFGSNEMSLGTNVYWSLAVEEHFYLMFPLLYLALLRLGLSRRNQALSFLAICLLVLFWRCVLVFNMGSDSDRIFYGTDSRIDSILFGCLLAVYGNPMLDSRLLTSERILKYVLFPLGLLLIICSLLIRDEGFRDTLRYTAQGIGLYPVFITAVRFPDWGLFQVLNWGWVRFVGVLSYSLYLVHYTVIQELLLLFPGIGTLFQGALSLLVSLLLSYGMYRLVEQPAARVKKRFMAR